MIEIEEGVAARLPMRFAQLAPAWRWGARKGAAQPALYWKLA
jgi:hypothetical protein